MLTKHLNSQTASPAPLTKMCSAHDPATLHSPAWGLSPACRPIPQATTQPLGLGPGHQPRLPAATSAAQPPPHHPATPWHKSVTPSRSHATWAHGIFTRIPRAGRSHPAQPSLSTDTCQSHPQPCGALPAFQPPITALNTRWSHRLAKSTPSYWGMVTAIHACHSPAPSQQFIRRMVSPQPQKWCHCTALLRLPTGHPEILKTA
ncbi:hypothetical protein V8C86DRAFT_1317552 [Haematococcus lacustris]